MYTLVTLADVVQITPPEFSKLSYRAIEDWINDKYADKVIHKVGLCVGFHSLVKCSEGLIGHGTGIVNVNVDFKVIVFRPFKGEIIRATITHSSQHGISLATDFYDDLHVPTETLYENSEWQRDDSKKYVWVWHAGTEDVPADYYFDNAESCLLRIEEEQWHDVSPEEAKAQREETKRGTVDHSARTPPYRLRGSMMQSGLGPTLWWTGEPVEEDTAAGATDEQAPNGT